MTEKNLEFSEIRRLVSCAVTAEKIGFPFAVRSARILRQRDNQKVGEVRLITDLGSEELSESEYFTANRAGW
jgi:hypothetical protein